MSRPETDPKPTTADVQRAPEELAEAPEKKLDLGALDLSVEKVEERISPSETNVFDK